jgi:hypothetical protein
MQSKNTQVKCTFAEMVEADLIPGLFGKCDFIGFTVGRGKQLFWHYVPTKNGFYKIYSKIDTGNKIGLPRYIEANKMVVCQPKNEADLLIKMQKRILKLEKEVKQLRTNSSSAL